MKRIILIASILFSFICVQGYAIVDLELTQGVAASIPLAVVPFAGANVSVPGNQTITQVISNDLQNSGEFRVVNQPAAAASANSDIAQWRAQGADYVVTGSITAVGDKGYSVAFQVRSAFNAASGVLLQQTFTASTQTLRRLAHHISDEIYKKLIGSQGIFSTKIAYIIVQRRNNTSQYKLEVADADGFGAQTLLSSSEPIMSPTWTPNGRELAYVSFEGHRAAIYMQNLATAQRRLVSAVPGINGAPAFSPDGTKLALVLSKSGNPNIYLLNLSNNQLQPITHDWSIDTEPSFSRDGSSILFTSNRDGGPQIYRYSIPTGTINRVTYTGDYNARASFAQNGQSIVVMHRDGGSFGIARMDLANGQLQTLVKSGMDESPSLAPNGKMIIYATKFGGQGVLAQVSVDGRIKLRLPAREGSVQEPAWSPFL